MEEKDFDITITKRRLLWEQCNDMCHNYYYVVYGKIYNKPKENEYRRFRRFKFVEWIDVFDLQEYYENKEYITKEDRLEFLDILTFSRTGLIKSYNDVDDFYNDCAETIRNYNKAIRGAWF